MENNMKVGVGACSIILSEDILTRLQQVSNCDYMNEEIGKIINALIDVYNGYEVYGDIIPAERCMTMISLLRDVQKDYAFLCTLDIEIKLHTVLGSMADDD